jgi:hypothetical protein
VIVNAPKSIQSVKATVTDLKSPGAVIPAAAVAVSYVQYTPYDMTTVPWGYPVSGGFDMLEASPPTQVLPAPRFDAAFLPVCVTVQVPPDVAAGRYAGMLTIRAEGEKPVQAPIQLRVVDWTLPKPQDFTGYMGVVQSPESVALKYNVKCWSTEHWKLLERDFELLGQLGNRELYLPLVAGTHFGNEHSMVRWIKQGPPNATNRVGGTPDGTYRHDFRIAEKYIDLAVRHWGRIPVVCLYCVEHGTFCKVKDRQFDQAEIWYTEQDAATGELKNVLGPRWGDTAGCQALWRPVIEGLRDILKKRGLENSLMIGVAWDGGVTDDVVKTFKTLIPDTPWLGRGHYYYYRMGRDAESGMMRDFSCVSGILRVRWDPAEDKPFYGWKTPFVINAFPRASILDDAGASLMQSDYPLTFRLAMEAVLLDGTRHPSGGKGHAEFHGGIIAEKKEFMGLRGIGQIGADFWPVLKGARGEKTLLTDSYYTVSLKSTVHFLLDPGKDGPVPSIRFQLLRESLQEAEARVFVQNALLDEALRAKLGKDLADRCTRICDDRTQWLRHMSEFWAFGLAQRIVIPGDLERRSAELYDLAAEVDKALNDKKR